MGFKEIDKKTVHKIDFLIIVGALLSLFIGVSFIEFRTPYVIFPQDNLTTSDENVLFSFENANEVLIDDNKNFTSPERYKVEDDFVIELSPGVYYWKVRGIVESEIRELTIESKVDLRMEETEINGSKKYVLTNAGNIGLNVEVYNRSKLERNFSLSKKEKENVEGNKFVGSQE